MLKYKLNVLILVSTQWSWMCFSFSYSVAYLRTNVLGHQSQRAVSEIRWLQMLRGWRWQWKESTLLISLRFLNYCVSWSLVKRITFAFDIFQWIFIQSLYSFEQPYVLDATPCSKEFHSLTIQLAFFHMSFLNLPLTHLSQYFLFFFFSQQRCNLSPCHFLPEVWR